MALDKLKSNLEDLKKDEQTVMQALQQARNAVVQNETALIRIQGAIANNTHLLQQLEEKEDKKEKAAAESMDKLLVEAKKKWKKGLVEAEVAPPLDVEEAEEEQESAPTKKKNNKYK